MLVCDTSAFPASFLFVNLDGWGSESEELFYDEFATLLYSYPTVFPILLIFFSGTFSVVSLYTGVIRPLCGTLILLNFVTVY